MYPSHSVNGLVSWCNTFIFPMYWSNVMYTYTAERRDVQPNSSRFEAVHGHSLIINPSLGMYQEIHPCGVSSIDSVKIITSLPMMRECHISSRYKKIQQFFWGRELPNWREVTLLVSSKAAADPQSILDEKWPHCEMLDGPCFLLVFFLIANCICTLSIVFVLY